MKKNKYRGLSTNISSREALTIEKFEGMIDYIMSDEFNRIENGRIRFQEIGQMIASKAFIMDLINEREYFDLLVTININGGLIISPTMYDKIKPAIEAFEKEHPNL